MKEDMRMENADAPEKTTGNDDTAVKKYSDADVDRIVSVKIMKERARFEKQQQEQLQENEFDKRERDLLIRERKADAREELSQQGLPKCMSELLNYNSDEEYKASMEKALMVVGELRQMFERERATGNTPRVYGNRDRTSRDREAFGL